MRLQGFFVLVFFAMIIPAFAVPLEYSTNIEPKMVKKTFWYHLEANDLESKIERDLEFCKLVLKSSLETDKKCQIWLKMFLKYLMKKLNKRLEEEIQRYKDQNINSEQKPLIKTRNQHILRVSK